MVIFRHTSLKMSIRLRHAKHNEEICNNLCSDHNNADWVVTIAFYSALHFVEYKIFPLQVTVGTHKVKIKNFSNYYSTYHTDRKLNKHSVRSNLVSSRLASISADYSWLKSTCWNARYVDYNFPNAQSVILETQKRLNSIKSLCEKK